MDRRSWLWRRKSSEKSPGETESSGSISSHSERFSDDQVYAIHNSQSPEVTSKAALNDEEMNDSVKSLTEKLSSALLNISAKEDLVKQHAKVAEEAVSGWEKAENEVVALKQQLEAATRKSSSLEDRVGHLDGALKECVRQLRQSREEQEQKIREAIGKKTYEFESTKFDLESQLAQLQAKLETATAEAAAPVDPDLRLKLEATERENASLKLELLSQAKELKMMTLERDLSTQAAEAASKQHLEDIRKVAKLEAECRRLNAIARKASTATDYKSFAAPSVYVDSFADSQSDIGERLLGVETDMRRDSGLELNECEPSRSNSITSTLIAELDQPKNIKALGRNHAAPSVEISLMDDFLEMERLAALPDTKSESCYLEDCQPTSSESALKAELQAMIHRTAELEERLERMEEEKEELEMSLTGYRKQLETSQGKLKEAESKLRELQTRVSLADESKHAAEEELKASNMKREAAESLLGTVKAEMDNLHSKIGSLEKELQKEHALSSENLARCQKLETEVEKEQASASAYMAKCRELEDEVLSMKRDAELQQESQVQRAAKSNGELKIKQEKELAVAASKFAECQKTIASLGRQLKSLASLEDFLMDDKSPELTNERPKNGVQEPVKLHSRDSNLAKQDSDQSLQKRGNDSSKNSNVSSEKSQNGIGKRIPRGRTMFRNESARE